jgi:NADH dehydrogenase
MGTDTHHIVVVGGGAGGIELVTRLAKKYRRQPQVRITLVDQNLTHIWKPLWHEVAAGTLSFYEHEVNYLIHSHQHHYHFELGRLQGLNRQAKQIYLSPIINEAGETIAPARSLHYDTLVLAIGSISNDFGILGAHEYCYALDSQVQAEQFHQKFLQYCIETQYEPTVSNKQTNVVIIGGGATGVELAAELHGVINQIGKLGWANVKATNIQLTLIEAGDRLLANLSPRISQAVQSDLTNRGIQIYTSQRVKQITPQTITTMSGLNLTADLIVWAAGIKAPAILTQFDGLETNSMNQIVVKPNLQSSVDNHIFAFGDCAACPQPGKDKNVPPRAQAAHQQAMLLVKTLPRHLAGQPLPNYRYHDYGSLISLSGQGAVGQLMSYVPQSLFIEGNLARFFYWSLFKKHQAVLFGIWQTTLLTIGQILTEKIKPRLKLH